MGLSMMTGDSWRAEDVDVDLTRPISVVARVVGFLDDDPLSVPPGSAAVVVHSRRGVGIELNGCEG